MPNSTRSSTSTDDERPRVNRGGRPRVPQAYSTVSSHIPTTDHDALVRLANARGESVSALVRIAAGRELDLSSSRITARVGIGALKSGGFGLAAALDLDAPQLNREQGLDLMAQAHHACPYSRATRGNIEVTLSVGGLPAEESHAAA